MTFDPGFKVAVFFEIEWALSKTVQDRAMVTACHGCWTLIRNHIQSIKWCHF